MKGHKTLKSVDLTINPLGEAGARSIFRSILRGVTCWVLMVSGNAVIRRASVGCAGLCCLRTIVIERDNQRSMPVQ